MIIARLHMFKDVVNAWSGKGKLLGARMWMFTHIFFIFILDISQSFEKDMRRYLNTKWSKT